MHVIVHGGAGSPADEPASRQAVLDTASERGATAQTPMAAVRTAVNVLEASPRFNAGTGSAVQSDGVIRTDAGVMTESGQTGAACAMPGVERAVDVAHVVATETPHILVAGEQAVELATAFDIPTDEDLWSDRVRERWNELTPPETGDVKAHIEWVHEQFGGSDTVGAVATDGEELVAATSTGGRWCALAGRVGDVPQVGSGFYASPTAAASATGAGEAIARFGLARKAVEFVEDGLGPQLAADRAIRAFEQATDEQAGVIVLDETGLPGESYNSPAMQTGFHRNR